MAIDNVSGGELIDPAWGNAVADEINHRGVKAYAVRNANGVQGLTVLTRTDITGLSVTFTATAGRLYRISAHMPAITISPSGQTIVRIYEGATPLTEYTVQQANANGSSFYPSALYEFSAGSHTLVVGVTNNAAGNAFFDPAYPSYLMVEDVGAA